ncbi:hypothetical protein BGZ63DRAFT_216776 [Mariannaea sp. PMI_226]|nr:hypothetical protein BGZ63DRAFT_216776 [Mariannaea sp. PMI_226]
MNIASMLNLSTGSKPQDLAPKGVTPPLDLRASYALPTSLPTPSPECMPAERTSETSENQVRTPWDAGGYSLPCNAATHYSRTCRSFRTPGDLTEVPHSYVVATAGDHSRHSSLASMESPMSVAAPSFPTPFPNPGQNRRMLSASDIQQDAWVRTSPSYDPRHHSGARRSSLRMDHGVGAPVRMGSSPRHRISDSRSSFSSLCSSTFSGGHSRLSSMSTVSGHQPSSVAVEMSLLESRLEQLPKLTPTSKYAEHQESSPRLPPLSQHASTPMSTPGLPQYSPSDPTLEVRATKRKRACLSIDQSHSSLRSSVLHPIGRIHKRTISAPNPPPLSSSPFARAPLYLPPITTETFGLTLPSPQLTMPRGRRSVSRGRRASRNNILPITIPISRPMRPSEEAVVNMNRSPPPQTQVFSTPIASSSDFQSRLLNICNRFGLRAGANLQGGDICMHVDNCNTGSVPRKVISHLFGRNKVCTRRIPERAWVCMCRKHYQRIRYRKGAEFSMTQIDLVYEQIARMIFWSQGLESNDRINVEGIFIRSWTFSIRKRELRRLVESNGQDPLPRWIIQSLGEGKTHDDILNVVERLHHDIQQGVLRDVPPVEFLPEVVDAYTMQATHTSKAIQREGSPDIDMQDATHYSAENYGDDERSPTCKDNSSLERVEEENANHERLEAGVMSLEASAISNDTQRPLASASAAHHQRQRSDSQINKPRDRAGHLQSNDRRNDHAEFDSQNPLTPPMNRTAVNFLSVLVAPFLALPVTYS